MGVSTTHRINLSMWILIYSFSDTYYVWAACVLLRKLVQMWYLLHICCNLATLVNPFFRPVARARNGLSVWDLSVYSHALPTDIPSPIFSEGRGWLYTGYLERIIPSSNCPSKLTDKVRRIVHSRLKLFHFQIKKYYLSDTNHQTDNPSHTNNPSLVWKRPFLL